MGSVHQPDGSPSTSDSDMDSASSSGAELDVEDVSLPLQADLGFQWALFILRSLPPHDVGVNILALLRQHSDQRNM